MTCLEARELLPELAVGVLPLEDREPAERHLQWCAGCRKEAAELGSAAALLALALEPAPVPVGLEDKIVARVRGAAKAPGGHRHRRAIAAAVFAAIVAVASLGWGAVMAGRADRLEERAERAEREQAAALERFQRIIAGVIPGRELAEDETHLGRLEPVGTAMTGGGTVLQLVSPATPDFVMVIVNGLDPADASALPYRVRLMNMRGEVLRAGRIHELDADGGAEVFRRFGTADLDGFTRVQVLTASGVVALSGLVDRSS